MHCFGQTRWQGMCGTYSTAALSAVDQSLHMDLKKPSMFKEERFKREKCYTCIQKKSHDEFFVGLIRPILIFAKCEVNLEMANKKFNSKISSATT